MTTQKMPSAAPAPHSVEAAAAYVIGHIIVKHPEKWDEYRSKVPATLIPWGGELVFRGKRTAVLNGAHPYTDTVVLRFPDAAAAAGWHDSPAYQALVPLRGEAAEVVLVSYQS
jgi:uncharacterized protein (DUF1330 family)